MPEVKEYIKELQQVLSEASEISALKVIQELSKIAFSTIPYQTGSEVKREDFDKLTDDQKDAVKFFTVETKTNKSGVETEYCKIELYDKIQALSLLSKMLGYDRPIVYEVMVKGK